MLKREELIKHYNREDILDVQSLKLIEVLKSVDTKDGYEELLKVEETAYDVDEYTIDQVEIRFVGDTKHVRYYVGGKVFSTFDTVYHERYALEQALEHMLKEQYETVIKQLVRTGAEFHVKLKLDDDYHVYIRNNAYICFLKGEFKSKKAESVFWGDLVEEAFGDE